MNEQYGATALNEKYGVTALPTSKNNFSLTGSSAIFSMSGLLWTPTHRNKVVRGPPVDLDLIYYRNHEDCGRGVSRIHESRLKILESRL